MTLRHPALSAQVPQPLTAYAHPSRPPSRLAVWGGTLAPLITSVDGRVTAQPQPDGVVTNFFDAVIEPGIWSIIEWPHVPKWA
ncbi:hypothetical protein Sviol_42230 [Streptomyces violascens]|uniref:Uncharacterized protein n=1 Tax=Streptomyces violascens TaxID=67381 RepID=A0ABQ3QRD2_9ACTN|nr:hypothetical protein Sviol_42230 [Streptomyces violascens]